MQHQVACTCCLPFYNASNRRRHLYKVVAAVSAKRNGHDASRGRGAAPEVAPAPAGRTEGQGEPTNRKAPTLFRRPSGGVCWGRSPRPSEHRRGARPPASGSTVQGESCGSTTKPSGHPARGGHLRRSPASWGSRAARCEDGRQPDRGHSPSCEW